MAQKTLDEVLEELKQIGVKDISKTTRLTINRIEDILNKRFEKIDRVRAQGFIHILEREYSVDLTEWLRLYGKFHNQEPLDTQDAPQTEQQVQKAKQAEVIDEIDIKKKAAKAQKDKPIQKVKTSIESLKLPKLESYNAPDEEDSQKGGNFAFFIILIVIIIGIVGVLGYKMFFQEGSNTLSYTFTNTPSQESQSSEQPQEQNPQDSQQTQDTTNEANQPQEGQESDQADEQATPNLSLNDRLSDSNNEETQTNHNEPNTLEQESQSSQNTQNAQNELSQNQLLDNTPIPANVARVLPSVELWVGVVNLETRASSQMTLRNAHDFTLDKPMVFVFGHNDFTLTFKGQRITYKARQFVRLYFDGNEIKEINYTTYRQLNPVDRW